MKTKITHCESLTCFTELASKHDTGTEWNTINIVVFNTDLSKNFMIDRYYNPDNSFYLLTSDCLYYKSYGVNYIEVLEERHIAIEELVSKVTSKPKIGDFVVITESNINWAIEMEDQVGKIVRVVNTVGEYGQIEFDCCREWSWCQKDLHFRPAFSKDFVETETTVPSLLPGKYVFYTSALHTENINLKVLEKLYNIKILGWTQNVLDDCSVKGIVVNPYFHNNEFIVGKGIAQGIEQATAKGIKCFVLHNGKIHAFDSLSVNKYSTNWAKVGTLKIGSEIPSTKDAKIEEVHLDVKTANLFLVHAYKTLKLV